jgi:hypothetical protein
VNRLETYNNPNVDYTLITRDNYQTGIVYKARSGYKNNSTELYRSLPAEGMSLRGMQTWAWREEIPVILHDKGGAKGRHSFTSAGGYNTAKTNATDWKELPSQYEGVKMLLVQNDKLWTLYIFTQSSTVTVYGGVNDTYHTQWFMNPDYLQPHSVNTDKKTISFENGEGQISWLKGEVKDYVDRVEFMAKEQPVAYGFSNVNFMFNASDDPWNIVFSDDSGSYKIELKDIILR